MAANLKGISDRVRDFSKTKQTYRRKPETKATKFKSRGLLAHRTNGQPPFFAWVEPETMSMKEYHYPRNAEYSAIDEERRLQNIQNAKQEKLKKFQHDVRERVKTLEKVKQLKQLDKSYEAVTAEQNIIYQSSFPKKIATTKKDTCVYREAKCSSLQVGIPGSCRYGYSVVNDPEQVNIASQLLDKQVSKVQTCINHARKALGSQILNIDVDQLTQLPGGIWNDVKKVTQVDENQGSSSHQNCGENPNISIAVGSGKELSAGELIESIRDMSMHEHEIQSVLQCEKNGRRRITGAHVFDDEHYQQENMDVHNEIPREKIRLDVKSVQKHKVTEDLLRPDKVKEQSKKQLQKQLAVYRRLFMDIEREQVRENLRMKEHRKRMTRLKNNQEIRRKETEYEIDEIIEERNIITKQKTLLEEQIAKENVDDEVMKQKRKLQKEKELERYTHALHATLKERLSKRQIEVPSLCSCGPTIFDTNPDKCANNCIFYKNPKGYLKALSSVLSSMDLDL